MRELGALDGVVANRGQGDVYVVTDRVTGGAVLCDTSHCLARFLDQESGRRVELTGWLEYDEAVVPLRISNVTAFRAMPLDQDLPTQDSPVLQSLRLERLWTE